jgi:hypothetical protein
MMKKKVIKNVFTFLGLLCVIALGYIAIVGSGDDNEVLYSDDYDLKIFIARVINSSGISPTRRECKDIRISDELYNAGFYSGELNDDGSYSLVDRSVTLRTASVSFEPAAASLTGTGEMDCGLLISGTTVAQATITGYTHITVSFLDVDRINETLADPEGTYEFCGYCVDEDFTAYDIPITAKIGVKVTLDH